MIFGNREFDFCSMCPCGKVGPNYHDKDTGESCNDVWCKALDKRTHTGLNWKDIAYCTCKHEGLDTIPDECPILVLTK